MSGLSDRAKKLIPKARIVSFSGWDDLSSEAIARLQTADDHSQYLTDEDLAVVTDATPSPDSDPNAAEVDRLAVVKQLRDQAADIVDEARADVLETYPGILEPGGGLHPSTRADACWRDFWQFLRCITYGIAGGHVQYTSASGLTAMEQLYEELQVPLPAMVTGLKGVKSASLRRVNDETQQAIAPYFDHLITQLSAFLKDAPKTPTNSPIT